MLLMDDNKFLISSVSFASSVDDSTFDEKCTILIMSDISRMYYDIFYNVM